MNGIGTVTLEVGTLWSAEDLYPEDAAAFAELRRYYGHSLHDAWILADGGVVTLAVIRSQLFHRDQTAVNPDVGVTAHLQVDIRGFSLNCQLQKLVDVHPITLLVFLR